MYSITKETASFYR